MPRRSDSEAELILDVARGLRRGEIVEGEQRVGTVQCCGTPGDELPVARAGAFAGPHDDTRPNPRSIASVAPAQVLPLPLSDAITTTAAASAYTTLLRAVALAAENGAAGCERRAETHGAAEDRAARLGIAQRSRSTSRRAHPR